MQDQARLKLPLRPMIIVVNARLLIKDGLEGMGYFIRETVRVLAETHPGDQFILLFDRTFDADLLTSPNLKGLVVPPPARHPLLWKFWFDLKIPLVLKKLKADVFLSPDGFCSLTTQVPQCLVVHDLGFLHHPEAYQKSHERFYRHFTPRFLKKARSIATVSAFSKKDIMKVYHTAPEKIDVVYNGVKEIFHPMGWEDRGVVKDQYARGCEYFLYAGALQPRKNLISLLKAFSIFKKRQQSEMKLVLAGRLAWKNENFLRLLETYKYKDEVILTGYLPEQELARVMAAAYALVYPSFFEGFGVPVLEAMKCAVPVLTAGQSAMEEIGEDAALYFDPHDHQDMAEKLMLIYKDEALRKTLSEKGRQVAEKYSWERTAGLLWETILKAVEKKGK